MNQLPKKYQQYCLAITYGLFADMLNPKNQGPNFTWDKFPVIASDWAEGNIGLYYGNVSERHKKMIAEECKLLAERILKRSEINLWFQK
jgi:hypothetical protein